jgi:hypothetical protein
MSILKSVNIRANPWLINYFLCTTILQHLVFSARFSKYNSVSYYNSVLYEYFKIREYPCESVVNKLFSLYYNPSVFCFFCSIFFMSPCNLF